MESVFRSSLQRWERMFFRTLTAVLCILMLVGIWLSRFGLPSGMADPLMRRIDTGAFAIEAETIRLSLFKGVRLNGVSVYRRGKVGLPVVEASEVVLWVDPFGFLRGVGTVQRVDIRDGELRPDVTVRLDKGSGETMGLLQTDVVLERCRVHGVMVEALQTQLRLSGRDVYLDDLRLSLARGDLRGQVSGQLKYNSSSNTLTGRASMVMDPRLALPVLEAWDLQILARLFRRFEFGDALPDCTLSFEAECVSGGRITVDGTAHLRSARYRGVEAMQADAALRVEAEGSNTVVTLNPLSVVRRDGTARGVIVIDLGDETVRFDARSSLDPHLLSQALGILDDPFWDRWVFEGPVTIDARGVVGYESLRGTDFTATFDSARIRYRNHQVEHCRFNMRMTDQTNVLSSVRARLYGGELTGGVRFVLPEGPVSNTAFDVAMKVKDVDFERVTDVLIDKKQNEFRGRLSGKLALRGLLGEQNVATVYGNGLINIDDGRVFMLPLFGGLSDIMTRIIPGLDFVLRQSDAFAEFRVAESRVTSEKTKIQGSVLSLSGSGHCGFDKSVDYHVQVKLMKDNNMVARLIRLLTFPISKLFEFRLRGTLDDPHWYPVNFSGDLLEKLGLRRSE